MSSRDNWERLVAAVLKREQLWQLFHQDSISTISSDDFSGQILSFSSNSLADISVSPPPHSPLTNPSASQASKNATTPFMQKPFAAWYRRRKAKDTGFDDIPVEEDLGINLAQVRRFSLRELKVGTDNFSNKNALNNGYNKVYKGRLADGSAVAVKRFKDGEFSQSVEIEFLREVEINSIPLHPNVLHMLGICITENERLIIYPLLANGSVASWLRGRHKSHTPLNWPVREGIARGAARGLAYLHDKCDPQVIHRDIKAANILLDEDFEAVVADFELALIMDYDVTHAATAVRGTVGHIAPDYLFTGKCSKKADVFGYGIFLLELITGQRAFDLDRSHKDEDVLLLDWVRRNYKERKWEMMVDADCRSNYMEDVVEQLVQIALLCTQSNPEKRPKMSEIVRMLEVGDGLAEKLDECYEKEDEQEPYPLDTINVGRVLRERGRATNFVTSPYVSQVSNHASSTPITWKLFSAWHRKGKSEEEFMVNIPEHLRIHLGRLRRFSLHELQVATKNFSNKNVFQDAYNKAYKGWLADGSAVVVKGHKDTGNFPTAQDWFQKEVEINSIATHPNVLHVLGFCITKKEWLLVYPLMVNESVASWLRERPEALPPLNWPIRKRIALGAARALAHLHYECDKKIIYRNIKAANILLDEDFEAVVANFENAETVDCNDTHATTAVVGTIGYIAPEYLATGVWSVKTDVYGYGIFLLELITGQGPFDLAQLANDCGRLLQDLHHVKKLLREGRWRIIIDQDCKNEVDVVTVQLMVIAILCTQSNPEERPKMPDVVSMLELEDVLELEDGMPREWHGVQIQWSEQEISLPEDEYIPDEIFDSPR